MMTPQRLRRRILTNLAVLAKVFCVIAGSSPTAAAAAEALSGAPVDAIVAGDEIAGELHVAASADLRPISLWARLPSL